MAGRSPAGVADWQEISQEDDKNSGIVLLDYYMTGEATPAEGSFSECLLTQIEEMEDRKNRKMRGEDRA